MTTIAYKDGIVACDGLMTAGGTILSHNSIKKIDHGEAQFFVTGTPSDHKIMCEQYDSMDDTKKYESVALVVAGGELFRFGQDSDSGKFFLCPMQKENPDSIGRGSDHALTAMDMGATAREAVEMAAKRDIYTGGTIIEYVVFPELVKPTIAT